MFTFPTNANRPKAATLWLLLLFVASLSSSSKADTTPVPPGDINKYPYNTVGRISQGDYFFGSGVAVGQRVVLTAGHVLGSLGEWKGLYLTKIDIPSGALVRWFGQYNTLDTGPAADLSGLGKVLREAPAGQGKVGRYVVWGDDFGNFSNPFSVARWNRDYACVVFFEDIATSWAPLIRNASESDLIEDTTNRMMAGYPFG